jgi:DNA-binding transcriptional LysR family regulator
VKNTDTAQVKEEIDLVIRVGSLKDSSMIARRFFDLALRPWTSRSCLKAIVEPHHPKDPAKHRFVRYTGMKSLQLSKGRAEVGMPIRARVVVDDFEAIEAMLVLGKGIGLLPDFLAAEAVASGKLVPVLPDWKVKAVGGFSFVYPGQKYASPKVQAFIETALLVLDGVKNAP